MQVSLETKINFPGHGPWLSSESPQPPQATGIDSGKDIWDGKQGCVCPTACTLHRAKGWPFPYESLLGLLTPRAAEGSEVITKPGPCNATCHDAMFPLLFLPTQGTLLYALTSQKWHFPPCSLMHTLKKRVKHPQRPSNQPHASCQVSDSWSQPCWSLDFPRPLLYA